MFTPFLQSCHVDSARVQITTYFTSAPFLSTGIRLMRAYCLCVQLAQLFSYYIYCNCIVDLYLVPSLHVGHFVLPTQTLGNVGERWGTFSAPGAYLTCTLYQTGTLYLFWLHCTYTKLCIQQFSVLSTC